VGLPYIVQSSFKRRCFIFSIIANKKSTAIASEDDTTVLSIAVAMPKINDDAWSL
jgi:hypothetical protein